MMNAVAIAPKPTMVEASMTTKLKKIIDWLVKQTNRDKQEIYIALRNSLTDPRYKHYCSLRKLEWVIEDSPCKTDYYIGCKCDALPLTNCPHCGAYMTIQAHTNKETGRYEWFEPRAAICEKWREKKLAQINSRKKQTQTHSDLTKEVEEMW